MLTDLKSAKKVTGAKQVTRALKTGRPPGLSGPRRRPRVTEPIELLCREQGTETEAVATMAALGSACGIAVGSAWPPWWTDQTFSIFAA
ncbi:MAG: 50S ribosomal protein L7ae-like protein [Evtepia gabavorous]